MVVTLDEIKKYLRVDFEDDDVLLRNIMESAQTLCMDVARMTDEDAFEEEPCARIAVMYAVAYLYEHREDDLYGMLNCCNLKYIVDNKMME